MSSRSPELLTVEEAMEVLGLSRATVWRRIARGELPSVKQQGRRLVPSRALRAQRKAAVASRSFGHDNPIWRLVGAFSSEGVGATDKHALLDEE